MTSQSRPATHAGPLMDQIARESASLTGHERIVWRPEEELAMERALKRHRIATISIFNLTVEIRLQARKPARPDRRLVRAAERTRLTAAVTRDRDLAHARWIQRG